MDEVKVDVVRKYYFRKNGVLETHGYDWIGEPCCDLYPVELGGKLGFADQNGELVIPMIYDARRPVVNIFFKKIKSKIYLLLRKNGKYGLIGTNGKVVVEFKWDYIDVTDSSKNLIIVELNGKCGFVNIKTKKIQIEPAYDKVTHFDKDGFALVWNDKKWGMIDMNGNVVIQLKYLLPFEFTPDFAHVCEGAKDININHKVIDRNGNEILYDYQFISTNVYETLNTTNLFWVSKDNKKYLKRLIPQPEYILVIDGGSYEHNKYLGDGKLSAIDYKGNTTDIPLEELQEIEKKFIVKRPKKRCDVNPI